MTTATRAPANGSTFWTACGSRTIFPIRGNITAWKITFLNRNQWRNRGQRCTREAKELIAEKCDAYLMHGDPPERVHEKIADLRERRAKHNLPPLKFGVAGYAIVRDTEREAQDELRRITDVQQSAAGYANYQQWLAGTQLE